MRFQRQRIRDPLHNLIEFDSSQFEHTLWQVIQTPPFQRLRRIRQLGFSELVYPGATHSRFAHSVGVFHTARRLMEIIRRHTLISAPGYREHQAQVALAAALVHDVGHGMFSHAFEEIGKLRKYDMAQHELVSQRLIVDSEISHALSELGSGFANDVAVLIGRKGPSNLYDAVVSSQFDADRLDYMRRDRLMTGVQNSGIDFEWLIANIEVGELTAGTDEELTEPIETFVLGPKSIYAAETFVLALFQLYPTIYMHKATRSAEKIFSALMMRVFDLVDDGETQKIGLPVAHPFVKFGRNPKNLDLALELDDSVFWGALPSLAVSRDRTVSVLANRLKNRRLHMAIDLMGPIEAKIGPRPTDQSKGTAWDDQLRKVQTLTEKRLGEWTEENSSAEPRILFDRAERDPYGQVPGEKGPLNQIHILNADQKVTDISEHSAVVRAMDKFRLFRAYVDKKDEKAQNVVHEIVKSSLGE